MEHTESTAIVQECPRYEWVSHDGRLTVRGSWAECFLARTDFERGAVARGLLPSPTQICEATP